MKMPKEIKIAELYYDENNDENWTTYKFRGEMYKGCYQYVRWWKNPEGKWIPFFKYIEKGNVLYWKLEQFLKTGEKQLMVRFIY